MMKPVTMVTIAVKKKTRNMNVKAGRVSFGSKFSKIYLYSTFELVQSRLEVVFVFFFLFSS